MYAFGLGWSVVVVCSRDDTGALRLQTTASPIFSLTIRLIWVELRGFEPLTPSLRTIPLILGITRPMVDARGTSNFLECLKPV